MATTLPPKKNLLKCETTKISGNLTQYVVLIFSLPNNAPESLNMSHIYLRFNIFQGKGALVKIFKNTVKIADMIFHFF